MENISKIMKTENITPFLKLANKLEGGGTEGTGKHTVKLISDKLIKGTEYMTGREIAVLRLLVEENGEKKKYDVPVKNKQGEVSYLIQHLAEFKEGDKVIMEYIKKGMKGYINITSVSSAQQVLDATSEQIIDNSEDIGEQTDPFEA